MLSIEASRELQPDKPRHGAQTSGKLLDLYWTGGPVTTSFTGPPKLLQDLFIQCFLYKKNSVRSGNLFCIFWYQKFIFWYQKIRLTFWYQKRFPFFISKIFLISENIFWYQKINFWYQKINFWYKKIDILISKNIFWYQKIEKSIFWYQKISFDIRKSIFWYKKTLNKFPLRFPYSCQDKLCWQNTAESHGHRGTVARYVCFCCLFPARRLCHPQNCGGQKQEAGWRKKTKKTRTGNGRLWSRDTPHRKNSGTNDEIFVQLKRNLECGNLRTLFIIAGSLKVL